jgi:hypothetical protein
MPLAAGGNGWATWLVRGIITAAVVALLQQRRDLDRLQYQETDVVRRVEALEMRLHEFTAASPKIGAPAPIERPPGWRMDEHGGAN